MRKPYYAPQTRANSSQPSTHKTAMSPVFSSELTAQTACDGAVRFVLKSASYLDVKIESIREEVEVIGGQASTTIVAITTDGAVVVIPWQNVDYLTEIPNARD